MNEKRDDLAVIEKRAPQASATANGKTALDVKHDEGAFANAPPSWITERATYRPEYANRRSWGASGLL